jgi:phosphohistidine phosphatase
MKLFLVRHGIAVDGIGGEIKSDAQRPLTTEGHDETEQVAKGLKKTGLRLDLLVSSPLVRARQTAEIFKEVFKVEQMEICEALAPAGEPSDIYKFLHHHKKAECIALFGHEPNMGELAQNLLQAEFYIPFKKAGVCRIDVHDMPPKLPGELKWFLPPKLSKAMK